MPAKAPGAARVSLAPFSGDWVRGVGGTVSSLRRLAQSANREKTKRVAVSASERRGNDLKGLKDFDLKAKAIFWPWRAYTFHIRSTAVNRDDLLLKSFVLRMAQANAIIWL